MMADFISAMPLGPKGPATICHMRTFARGALTLVVLTEIPVNPGKSITNCFELLATDVVRRLKLDAGEVHFYEHYTPDSYPGAGSERWARVHLIWDGIRFIAPEWEHLPPERARELGIA